VGTTKFEGEDDVQKEQHKLRNAKHAGRKQRIPEQHQH
jgi:hypothetical protein